jgi:hypothetical protein
MQIEELFVPIQYWENYAVSNYGRVINLVKGFELNQRVDRVNGRMKVRFYVLAAYIDLYVDDLVTQAFFVEYHHGVEVFYKNGNKRDCTVLNLTFDPKYRE